MNNYMKNILTNRYNRSSKLQYWAGMCGDLGNKEWQDGGVVNISNKNQRRLMAEVRSGCP